MLKGYIGSYNYSLWKYSTQSILLNRETLKLR